MLIEATREQIETYADFVYGIACDSAHSGYPTYADGVKTKEDFLLDAYRAAQSETAELLLFVLDGKAQGWLSYFWLREDRYLQLTACNVARGTKQALEELLHRLSGRFAGDSLYFGFPAENREAIACLRAQGFERAEESWNTVYRFGGALPGGKEEGVVKIGAQNFALFRQVYHAPPDAYWSAERILQTIDDWLIFVYNETDTPRAAIFLRGDGGRFEIFGLEGARDAAWEAAARRLLTAALRACETRGATSLTYFCGETERQLLDALGFRCVGKYELYTKTLQREDEP